MYTVAHIAQILFQLLQFVWLSVAFPSCIARLRKAVTMTANLFTWNVYIFSQNPKRYLTFEVTDIAQFRVWGLIDGNTLHAYMHWSNLVSACARQLPRKIPYAFIHSLQELRPCVFLGRTTFTQLIRELLVFYGTKIFISLFYSLDHILNQLNTVHTIMTYLLHPIHLAFICAIQQSNNIGVCSDGLCIVSSTEVVLLSIGGTANYMFCATSTTAD
jgi:hypothetical protein